MHAVGELPCGSQPPAPTCVVWSWRLKGCFPPALVAKGSVHRAFGPVCCPTAMPCWWWLTRPKQLSMATTAWVIWLCACVRYRPDHGLVFECVTCFHCCFILWVKVVFTVAWLNPKAFQWGWKKQHKHPYSFFLLPCCWITFNLIQTNQILTTHNANRHCRVHFYTFVGQPLSKQLYIIGQLFA